MDKPFVIRYSEEEESNDEKEETAEYMVNNIVSYFTHTDPEGHRKKWKKKRKSTVKTEIVDYYYI